MKKRASDATFHKCFVATQAPTRQQEITGLHLNAGLGRNQRQGLLLGVLGIDLDDGKVGGAGRKALTTTPSRVPLPLTPGVLGWRVAAIMT